MKKLFQFCLACLLLTGIQCSEDSEVNNPPPQIDRSANLLSTGDSAGDFLANGTYSNLEIEVVHVNGFRPTDEAMGNFLDFIRARTFKNNVQVSYTAVASPEQPSLSLQEIAELETENRTAYNEGNTLSLYIYFADSPSVTDNPDDNVVTLGAVYRNTSMVIHESTIRDLARRSGSITTADVETATLMHELGHLLGLVDLGSPMVNNHEDTEAGNHCNVENCLMGAELTFGSGITGKMESRVLRGLSAVPELDAECLLDLQNNGGR